eukprot:5218108-Pleurochrysis_carterae.AAC.2
MASMLKERARQACLVGDCQIKVHPKRLRPVVPGLVPHYARRHKDKHGKERAHSGRGALAAAAFGHMVTLTSQWKLEVVADDSLVSCRYNFDKRGIGNPFGHLSELRWVIQKSKYTCGNFAYIQKAHDLVLVVSYLHTGTLRLLRADCALPPFAIYV